MQHRQTVVRYGHNNSSPSHLQRSGTSDLQRCCQTDDVVHAPLSSRNTSHVMNNRSLSVVSIYVQVISFCFYKLFSTVGPYPRVWPHDYRRVYGRMIPMGPFSVRGGIRRGGIRRAPTVGTRPIHVMFMQSDGVVFGGHTRGYAPTVGTRPIHVMFMQSGGGGIRRAYTGVCPYGGYAPDSCHVHAIRRGWYSTGVVSDGHTRGYAPTVGTHLPRSA